MALRDSQNLSLSQIGRSLKGPTDIKHKIKKVDRRERRIIENYSIISPRMATFQLDWKI